MSFEQHQQDLSPIRGPWSLRWAAAHGRAKDRLVERARQAVLAGAITRTPVDGLARLGADADLERSPIETSEQYRARILGAFDLYGWAGTPYGYAQALSLTSAEIRGARFVAQYQWPAPPDGRASLWSRFWVIVWTGALAVGRFTVGPWATVGGDASPFLLLVVGSFIVGDGSTVGSDITRAQLSEVRRSLAKWKNARDRVPALVLVDGGELVGMPGLIVGGFVVGGSSITYTLNLLVGSFTVGATQRTDPDGPWFPYIGHSSLV